MTPLLGLKYHDSIADAVADLGSPAEIGQVFTGFQPYLYDKAAANGWEHLDEYRNDQPGSIRARRTQVLVSQVARKAAHVR
jgi:hypothetical protein